VSLIPNPAITGIEEEGAFAILDRALKLKGEGKPVINLGIGQPDFNPPPHVLAAGERAAREGPHGYTSPVGIPQLREAVAHRVNKRTHAGVDMEQVVIVPGGKVTIFFACMMFGGAAAEILYPDPGFPPYREAVRAAGAKAVPYPIREAQNFGFEADEVLSLINERTRLIIVNSPANPTGGVVERRQLERLAEGLLEHPQVAVLSDEIYGDLVFDGAQFASFLEFPDIKERVILLDGWSKSYAMTGWRLGYGVWPKHLVDYVRKLITVDHSCVNVAAQMAGLAAVTGPQDAVYAMRQSFAERRDLVVRGLNRLPHVTCRTPGGAFYAFPNVSDTGWGSRELAQRLLDEAYVALVPGESFGDNGKGYLRLSYAASPADIEEALARMALFLVTSRPRA
jgi:aspartate/methionine/tyrosine aminotransferase